MVVLKPTKIIFHCMLSSFRDLHFLLNACQRFVFVGHGCILQRGNESFCVPGW